MYEKKLKIQIRKLKKKDKKKNIAEKRHEKITYSISINIHIFRMKNLKELICLRFFIFKQKVS